MRSQLKKKKRRVENKKVTYLDRLKRFAYVKACLTLPPENEEDAQPEITFADLLDHAKFFLAQKYHVMSCDKTYWDRFSDEQIMVEYYAHQFTIDEEMRNDFQVKSRGIDPDWMNKMQEENLAQIKKLKEEMNKQDSDLSFDPNKDV